MNYAYLEGFYQVLITGSQSSMGSMFLYILEALTAFAPDYLFNSEQIWGTAAPSGTEGRFLS